MKIMSAMNIVNKYILHSTLSGMLILIFTLGCERKLDDLVPATFPNTAEIFINGFSGGLEYAAFGDSKVTAFTVDENVSFEGLIGTSSMRFDIPNEGDPEGAYAGGIFRDLGGRDMSGYDAITFYAFGSKPGTIDLIGFGNDFMGDKYQASTSIKLNTAWTKYIIPIPDPSKLTQLKGLFGIAEGPEDGDGYSIWLDQVKFEKLGTLAHPRPAILNGSDVKQKTFIGVDAVLSSLSQTFNLPNGTDQIVNAAPSYFNFISSDTTVAKVDELGKVSVVGTGTAVITASIGGVVAKGSLTLESLGEFTSAPNPSQDPSDVISIFSDAYTNVPVDFYNGYFEPFQTTLGGADININGDNIIKYSELNFVATQFTQPTVDASEMTHFHVDIQVEDDMETGDFIKIEVHDFGADGAFGGGDDTKGSVTFNSPPLETGEWASLDIRLADLTGLTSTKNLAQIFFISDATISNILVDNMYFYKGTGGNTIPPTSHAPVPTEDATNVISIFSDAYTDVPNAGFNNYGAAAFEQVDIAGDATLKYTFVAGDGGNFQVIELGGANQIDAAAAGMTHFRFDLWFPNEVTGNSAYLMKLVDIPGSGATEAIINVGSSSIPVMAQGSWLQFDIPFTELESNGLGGRSNIQQIVIDLVNSGEVYIDNIYFYKQSSSMEPTAAAPTPPTRDAANVISIYSDAYTDISGINRNPDWGQSTQVSEVIIAGDNILKYADFNYQGTDFSGNAQNASGMQFLHIDMWTADATDVKVTPINASGSPAEALQGLTPITAGQWVSYDIPLTDFTTSGMSMDQVIQMKFDGQAGTTPSNIYLDNIYFYKEPIGTEPTTAAPMPPARDAANVISIYSDAYTDISGINRNPDWGQSTQVSEVIIEGDNILKYANFNYQGTDFSGNAQDASGMQFLHIDMWTADATDVKVTPINASGSPAESLQGLTPITAGQWVSYNIPLTDFTASGMSLDQVIQMKFDGQAGTTPSNIYLDNIYFYKADVGGGDGEFTTNGGFESGDITGWTSFATDNNGTFQATDAQAKSGTYSGLLVADVNGIGSPSFPVVKQANIGVGTITPNTEVTISFDLYGSLAGAGGVVFAEFFSELSEGGVSKAEILGGGPLFPNATWTNYTFTATTGNDVSGGITLQLKADCGGNAGCKIDAYFDNVSVKVKE